MQQVMEALNVCGVKIRCLGFGFLYSPFVAGLHVRLMKKSTQHRRDEHLFVFTADETGLLWQYLRELHCTQHTATYHSLSHIHHIEITQSPRRWNNVCSNIHKTRTTINTKQLTCMLEQGLTDLVGL